MFRDIPEIEDVGEKPLAEVISPKLLKKAMGMPKMRNKTRATLFVTLGKN